MPKWNRVWRNVNDQCPQSCINFTNPALRQQSVVLDQFPSTVDNMSQAMRIVAEGIAERVGGKSIVVKSESERIHDVSMRLSRDVASLVSINFSFGAQANYPVEVTYNYRDDSGTAKFGDIAEVVEWLAVRLR